MTTPVITQTFQGPRVVLQAQYGLISCVWTDSNHVSVVLGDDSYPAHLTDPGFEYRSKNYQGGVHLFADSNHGEWSHDGHAAIPAESNFSVRTDRYPRPNVPPTYRAAFLVTIREAVLKFLAANPGVLKDAARTTLKRQLTTAEAAEADALRDAAIYGGRVAHIKSQLAAL